MRRLLFLATATAILAFAVRGSTARAAEGQGHGGDHGPAKAGGAEGAHAGPMKLGERGDTHIGIRLPPKEIPHEGGVSIFGGKEHHPDEWRYKYEHGEWWYWMPNNHWTYYDKGAWQNYAANSSAENSTVELPVPSDPNYYWHKNQWWYLSKDNHWSYYDKGRWQDGPPGMAPPRRESSVMHSEPNKTEHLPRNEGFEGKKK